MKVLGISQGQGALLFPLKNHVVANIEPRSVFHTKNEEQWVLNFGDIPFVKTFEEVKLPRKVDVILGSPNCGHSSILSFSRKKSLGNPKEDVSLNLFIEGVHRFQPKLFLMENLPTLLKLIPIEEWEQIFSDYELLSFCHPVSEFGNSQIHRKRLILLGIKKKLSRRYKDFFKGIYPVNILKSSRELHNLAYYECMDQPISNYFEDHNKKLAMYDYRDKDKKTLTVKQVHDLWAKDFKVEYKWPIKSSKMKTLPGVYRNRREEAPMTVRPSNRQFNYDGWPLSLWDYKIIQGFPTEFQVFMDWDNKGYWLNKARITLTKGPVYEIGIWFKECLERCPLRGRMRNKLLP